MKPNITFCLMVCGEETEKECLEAIAPFRDKIVFQEVRNISPQITALNKMLEQVETPYLVPLDADMVLNPDAYERIRRAVDKYSHDPNWHTILFPLWDTLTEKDILALKVFRTEIVKLYPFAEGPTPDVEHYGRLTAAGYTVIDAYLKKGAIGNHVVRGPHYCYHKYKDVYMTLRNYGWEWDCGVFMGGKTLFEKSQKHFNYFLTKYFRTGNVDYIYCIAGMADGITSPLESKSKNLAKKCKFSPREGISAYMKWALLELEDKIPIFF